MDQQAEPEQFWRITTAGIQLALGPGNAAPADGESSSVWLTRGARRVPYRGVAKNNTWLHHRAAGLNLRRLLNLGLAWSSTGWVTA